MEKILDNHNGNTELLMYSLHKCQHAHRSDSSTALYALTTELEETLKYKEVCLVLFLDITGPIDNTLDQANKQSLEGYADDVVIVVREKFERTRREKRLKPFTIQRRGSRSLAEF